MLSWNTRSIPTLFPNPQEGVVSEPISDRHPGRVKYEGTYWSARLYGANEPMELGSGAAVRVVARQGITLLVVPDQSDTLRMRPEPLTNRRRNRPSTGGTRQPSVA